jgi:hypothetical protein
MLVKYCTKFRVISIKLFESIEYVVELYGVDRDREANRDMCSEYIHLSALATQSTCSYSPHGPYSPHSTTIFLKTSAPQADYTP